MAHTNMGLLYRGGIIYPISRHGHNLSIVFAGHVTMDSLWVGATRANTATLESSSAAPGA